MRSFESRPSMRAIQQNLCLLNVLVFCDRRFKQNIFCRASMDSARRDRIVRDERAREPTYLSVVAASRSFAIREIPYGMSESLASSFEASQRSIIGPLHEASSIRR
jgi:hypothetical protein